MVFLGADFGVHKPTPDRVLQSHHPRQRTVAKAGAKRDRAPRQRDLPKPSARSVPDMAIAVRDIVHTARVDRSSDT
eukprot:2268660-Rhodomonas_salina.1